MYKKAGIVHADLSVYNILLYEDKPYIIDLGQGVVLEHPMSHEFLKRDIYNIVQYFNKYNVKSDVEIVYKKIIK
jgi:RIO kinase 1